MALPLLLLAPVLSPVQAEPAPLPASVRPLTEDQIVDVPGELVISFRSAEAPEDLDAVVASWELAGLAPGLRIEGVRELLQWQRRGRTDLTTVVLIDYAPEDLDLAPLREALSARADIEFATPNRVFVGDPREIDPNDPQYGSQYHHPLMQNDDAWNTTFGSASVIIGVTDDGVDIDHADLAPNVWTNTGEIPGDGIDNDGNGYVDDVNGWDFSGDNDDPRPNSSSNDHGTHCAGISAAKVNNSIGVAGTAGDCSIMALQFYLGGGSWTAAVIAETFAYGADNGARIMTTSYNMDGWAGDPVVTAGFDYMYDHGVLHFNSAGNGSSADPARQVFHQSMLVASTDSSDLKSGFSNWGTGIDVAAPGSSVLSTITNGGYDTKSGTSMASPNAAGVAGLIWSAHPTWNRDQVAAQIYGTGDDIDGLNPAYAGGLGGGRVNSFRGVNETLAPPAIESVVGLLPDGSVLIDPSLDFTVRFDKILDPIAANDPLSTRIDYAGGDGVFGTADDQMIALNSTEYLIGSNEQRFTLGASLTTVGLHRVIIDAALLTDPFGTPIDANGDGIAGDSYVSTFEVCPLTELFTDPAESGAGWSVTSQNLSAGAWTPNPEVPVGGGARYDPAADYDGSGRCFLTQNGAGDTDVDGGPTRLVSRAFDVGGQPEALISFALWINATRTDDTVQLHISGDDGANWTLVETYTSFGGWQRVLLRVADYVTPSANVRLRWSATDGGTPSILEAAVDDIRGFVVNCGGPGTVGVEVCTAAPNSSGQAASISGMGSSLVPDNDFTLTAAGCPPSQFGLFFSGRQLSGVFLGNGLLCIGGTLTRVSGALAVDGTGTAVLPLDLTSPAGAIDAVTGVTAYYQFWFRDSVGAGSNLSTALEVQWL